MYEAFKNYNFDIRARDDNVWTVLHKAAKSGDIELFQYFIENGSNVYSKTKKRFKLPTYCCI